MTSKKFTGAEWRDPNSGWFCDACAWLYREPALRRFPLLVDAAAGTFATLDTPELLREAMSQSLPSTVAVTLPDQLRRKHTLGLAEWGRVYVDGAAANWTAADAALVPVLARIRAVGFPAASITEPAPPWRILSGIPGRDRLEVLTMWERLSPWRDQPLWLRIGLAATHPHKTRP